MQQLIESLLGATLVGTEKPEEVVTSTIEFGEVVESEREQFLIESAIKYDLTEKLREEREERDWEDARRFP